MKVLKIKQCPDRSRWYAQLIGQTVPFLGREKEPDEYKSRTQDGYINFVQIADAEIIVI
jgi:hypothetical protein